MNLIDEILKKTQSKNVDFGIAINYIEKEKEIMINSEKSYHLASVVKVPIMVEAFRHIEVEKSLKLEEKLELKDSMKLSGTGILKYLTSGSSFTVEDIMLLMIIISDNTATDTLLERLGGPQKVDTTMKRLGFNNLHTKMTIRQAHWDRGIREEPLIDPKEGELYRRKMELIFDSACYTASPKGNSSTPHAMTGLLCKIFNGEVWSKRACDKMMELMYKQQRNTRIPKKLPRGTFVAHKTGTITGVANDAGIMEIDEKNHCAITIFTKDNEFMKDKNNSNARKRLIMIEAMMGDISLLAHNYGKKLI